MRTNVQNQQIISASYPPIVGHPTIFFEPLFEGGKPEYSVQWFGADPNDMKQYRFPVPGPLSKEFPNEADYLTVLMLAPALYWPMYERSDVVLSAVDDDPNAYLLWVAIMTTKAEQRSSPRHKPDGFFIPMNIPLCIPGSGIIMPRPYVDVSPLWELDRFCFDCVTRRAMSA
ncbi:MAG: hypothetical protein WC477_00685 [Patescibacteria group bacterium]